MPEKALSGRKREQGKSRIGRIGATHKAEGGRSEAGVFEGRHDPQGHSKGGSLWAGNLKGGTPLSQGYEGRNALRRGRYCAPSSGVKGTALESPCEVTLLAMYNLALLPFVFCCGPSGLRLVVKG